MIDTRTVTRALTSLERHAPAEADVLAGLHRGIAGRRRRRQLASVAGVAAAASLVALGVVLVAPDRGSDPAGVSAAAVRPPSSAPPAAPAPPVLPFTVGLVPG